MTKSEFLETLEMKLSGEVSVQVINQNLRYYSDYIDHAVRQGKGEEEVLEELGSPFLIAKTIIEVNSGEQTQEQTFRGFREEERTEREERNENRFRESYRTVRPGILIAVLVGILLLAAVMVFTVLRLLLPVLLPVILVLFAVSLFKKRK